MAALTDKQYGDLRRVVYRKGAGKEELKALTNLPNNSELIAAFQVFEDFWDNNKAQVLADVRTALNRPTAPGSLVKKLGLAWLHSKFQRGG